MATLPIEIEFVALISLAELELPIFNPRRQHDAVRCTKGRHERGHVKSPFLDP
jgi:hypothetical protein